MADEPENLLLHYVRQLDAKMDRVIDEVHDLKVRMTVVEEGLAGVNRGLDRLEGRMDRIERRLDLVDTPASGREYRMAPALRIIG